MFIPVDPLAGDALHHAAAIAQSFNVRLDLVHMSSSPWLSTIQPGPTKRRYCEGGVLPTVKKNVRDTLQGLAEELLLPEDTVRVFVGQRPAVLFIVDVATENINLLVPSSRGQTGMQLGFIRGVAEKVIQTCLRPVFVVKAY